MQPEKLNQALYLALSIVFVFLIFWEFHWRNLGYIPSPEDNKHLWAYQRAKVERLDSNGIVLAGSSRVLFDFQLDDFEQEAGVRPIMLATAGASSLPVLKDLAENSDFIGTVIVGITPPLYFCPPHRRRR